MPAPITKLRIGLQPDTPEEHTRLLINVNTEAAQTSLRISTDLKVRANPATAKIYYYNFDGSELLYTETIEPGGNGSWDGEPGRAGGEGYAWIFMGWAAEPNATEPTEGALASVFSARRVYAAYLRRDTTGFVAFDGISTLKTANGLKNWNGVIFWSIDAATWSEWDGTEIAAGVDEKIYLRGTGNSVITGNLSNAGFLLDGNSVACAGNLEFLLDYETTLAGEHPSMGSNCFNGMFKGCTALTSPPELPATTLAEYCYYSMFQGCTALTSPPELPATKIEQSCYQGMFRDCAALTSPPELPATEIAQSCYQGMFQDCTALTSPPDLPATEMKSGCYWSMFKGCTALRSAPRLPAGTLASNCYRAIFSGCTGLTIAPELPATELEGDCYREAFDGCTSLTIAPELPATELKSNCYRSMFYGCTGLTSPPTIHAVTLASYCCYTMFSGCTALTSPPELPATTLAEYCYYSMFQGCTALTSPPELPAVRLVANCYYSMFRGCTKIKLSVDQTEVYATLFRIPTNGDGVQATNSTSGMFASTGGTFTGTPAINTTYYLAPPASA